MEKVELLECGVLARCDDATLVAGLKRESAHQRIHTARLIALMSEVDARGLYREYAYPSMFEYAVQALHMSEGEAYPRIAAGRLARKYPRVLEMLASGELHLSAIRLLGPVMNTQNAAELLAAARHKSKRQVEHMLAERAPKSDAKSSVRKLPASHEVALAGPLSANVPSLPFATAAESGDAGGAAATHAAACGASGPEQSGGTPAPACPGASSTAQGHACSSDGGAVIATVGHAGMTASSPPLPADVGSKPLHENSVGTSEVSCRDNARGSLVPCNLTPGLDDAVPTRLGMVGVGANPPAENRARAVATPRLGRSEVSPLGGDRYRVQFTASRHMYDKLEQARHLLRHQIPTGELAEIFGLAHRATDEGVLCRGGQREASHATWDRCGTCGVGLCGRSLGSPKSRRDRSGAGSGGDAPSAATRAGERGRGEVRDAAGWTATPAAGPAGAAVSAHSARSAATSSGARWNAVLVSQCRWQTLRCARRVAVSSYSPVCSGWGGNGGQHYVAMRPA